MLIYYIMLKIIYKLGFMKKNYKIKLTNKERQIFDILLAFRTQQKLNTVIRVAGGWVRDKIMGKQSNDIDIALDDMKGQQFAHLMADYFAKKGQKKKFGVISSNPDLSKHLQTATLQIKDQWIDIVNLRSQTYNQNSRIPQITIGTPKQDAQRRDLTINSLFYNIITQQIQDCTGKGIEDLENGIIRTPIEPYLTFKDDPLRILRTIRFASRYQFKIVEEIFNAIQNVEIRQLLRTKVSKQRISKQLIGMLKNNYPLSAFEILKQYNLWHIVFDISAINSDFPKQKINTIPEISVNILRNCLALMPKFEFKIINKHIKNEIQNEEQKKQNSVYYTLQELNINICLTALTFVFSSYSIINKKSKISLVECIIKQELKLSNKITKFVESVNRSAYQLMKIIDEKQLSLPKLIKWLKQIAQKWEIVFLILFSAYPQKSNQLSNLLQIIRNNKYEQAYLINPFIDGNYINTVLKKRGQSVKHILQNSRIWRILNPDRTQQEFLTVLNKDIEFFTNPNSYL